MIVLPMYEFLLWSNCNNNCKFCVQREDHMSSKEERLKAIELAFDNIKKLRDAHVLFMGGELFSEPDEEVKEKLKNLFDYTFDKSRNKELEFIYINTNLLYNTEYLFSILDDASDIIERIRFTTSDDVDGRFNEKSMSLFYNNLRALRNRYPKLRIVVNTILTKTLCDMIMNDEYNVLDYQNKYDVLVNNIPYINVEKRASYLAPTKSDVIKALNRLNQMLPGYMKGYCDNYLLKQDFHLLQFKNGAFEDVTSGRSECGHHENFKRCFSDSNECFKCVLQKIKDTIVDD